MLALGPASLRMRIEDCPPSKWLCLPLLYTGWADPLTSFIAYQQRNWAAVGSPCGSSAGPLPHLVSGTIRSVSAQRLAGKRWRKNGEKEVEGGQSFQQALMVVEGGKRQPV